MTHTQKEGGCVIDLGDGYRALNCRFLYDTGICIGCGRKLGEPRPTTHESKRTGSCGSLIYENGKAVGACGVTNCRIHLKSRESEKKCFCAMLDKPTYNVKDNPHSIEKKWSCHVHGEQNRYWLIHKTWQEDCDPCNERVTATTPDSPTDESWVEEFEEEWDARKRVGEKPFESEKVCCEKAREAAYLNALDVVEKQHELFPTATASEIVAKLRRLHERIKEFPQPIHPDSSTDTVPHKPEKYPWCGNRGEIDSTYIDSFRPTDWEEEFDRQAKTGMFYQATSNGRADFPEIKDFIRSLLTSAEKVGEERGRNADLWEYERRGRQAALKEAREKVKILTRYNFPDAEPLSKYLDLKDVLLTLTTLSEQETKEI